ALARARQSFADGAFESAVRAASEALAHAPDMAEAQSLKTLAIAAVEKRAAEEALERRAAEALQTAERRFEAGDHAGAISYLERTAPSRPGIAAALEAFRARFAETEEARRAEDERVRREAEERRRAEEARARREAEERRRLEEERRQREAEERQRLEDERRLKEEDERRRKEEDERRRNEEERRERERQEQLARIALVSEGEGLIARADFDGALRIASDLERVHASAADAERLRRLVEAG